MLCRCGKDLGIAGGQNNYMLSGIEHYCSAFCFLDALKFTETSPLGRATIRRSRLPRPFESWSFLTHSHYRSMWEVLFAEVMSFKDIKCVYEPYTLTLTNGQEYTPDFYLSDYNLFIETKGVWSGSGKKKLKQAISDGVRIDLLPYHLERSFSNLHKQLSSEIVTREQKIFGRIQ